MRTSRQRTRGVLLGAVGVAAALIGLAAWGAGTLERVERVSVDQRFQVRGDRTPPPDVVVVGIDEDTQAALDSRWPFPRGLQATVLDNLTAAGAAVIAYDIQLTTPTGEGDQRIYRALAAAPRVVLATSRYDRTNGPDVIFLDEDLEAGDIAMGHVAFPDTPDNVFRRVPLGVEGLASFSAVAAGRFRGTPVEGAGTDRSALIDYAGGPGTIPTIPYADVAADGFAESPGAEAVRGRVVVVGLTGDSLGDTHPTPFGGAPMAGPEINANAIATFLAGEPLSDAPGWLDVLLILVLAGAGAAASLRGGAWTAIAVASVVGALFLVGAQIAFSGGTVVAVTAPLLALGLATAGGVGVGYAGVDRQRRRLRAEFERFVPAEVVGQVMDRVGDDQRLGGRRIYCTVMFADLRGFTAAAERMPPETVIEMLNRYLGEMSDAILDHGGTIVSYMGDGIMALFGAPLEQEDHADRAVAAAREMRDVRLPRFNGWCAGRVAGEGFRMGIGVASGPVMSGNVGSERRMEYAAVGDTTNIASRLQSLTKETPAMVLIADSTRAALTGPVADLEAVGALDVRGRQVPAAVWTLGAGEPVSRA
ncbi:MAG: adenylate/guanylate cyclase domain-containing protein [Thermoleophilia bacterium]|nr:adenylate/guanylate cyclase domain-containing protein [Thermoleophilia bacterium]